VNEPRAVRGARDAHDLLVRSLHESGFSDAMARQPSLLPGWTVGHLLTHIARNADSYTQLIDAAHAGEIVVQYPGGPAQRETGIAEGADRSASELIDDLQASDDALAAALARVDPDRWRQEMCRWNDQPWLLADVPFLRWREVAIHGVDVGLESLTTDDWPLAYLEYELLRSLSGLSARLPGRRGVLIAPRDLTWSTIAFSMTDDVPGPFTVVDAPARDVLAWLVGRHPGEPHWPPLERWRGIP
jgi:maleylpyruvate isomerase